MDEVHESRQSLDIAVSDVPSGRAQRNGEGGPVGDEPPPRVRRRIRVPPLRPNPAVAAVEPPPPSNGAEAQAGSLVGQRAKASVREMPAKIKPRSAHALFHWTAGKALFRGVQRKPLALPAEIAPVVAAVEPSRIPEGSPAIPSLEGKAVIADAVATAAQNDLTLRIIVEEIRRISARQVNYERKYVLNSVFAYVIFCVLIFLGLYFVFDLRSAKTEVDAAYYEGEFDRLSERLSIAEAELQKYREASHLAFEVYQLIEQARHQEALDRYVEVQDAIVNPAESALLQARIDSLKWKLAEEAYRDGLDLFGKENYEQARDAFFKSLAYQPETPYSNLLNYHLGTSLYELGDFEGARHHFDAALEQNLPTEFEEEARYRTAVATQEAGQTDRAYDLFERFLKRNRYHKRADDVVRRMGRIERQRLRDRAAAQKAERERALQRTEAETEASQ